MGQLMRWKVGAGDTVSKLLTDWRIAECQNWMRGKGQFALIFPVGDVLGAVLPAPTSCRYRWDVAKCCGDRRRSG